MIMENTKLVDVSAEEAKTRGRYKYVCVVLQYDGPKLDKNKLTDVVRTLEGSNAAAKKQYNMRMVAGELSTALSGEEARGTHHRYHLPTDLSSTFVAGFEHNAVTPLGMTTPMPLLLAEPLQALPDVWLGGGEPDLKLRVDVAQFVACFEKSWTGLPIRFADVVG